MFAFQLCNTVLKEVAMNKNLRKLSVVLSLIFLIQGIIVPSAMPSMGKSGLVADALVTSKANDKNVSSDITSIQTTGAGAEYIPGAGNPNFQTDRFIIKYKKDSGREILHNKFNKKDFKRIDKVGKKQRLDVITFEQQRKLKDVQDDIKARALDSEIEYIQPDYLMSLNSNDPLYESQWGIQNRATSLGAEHGSTTPATLTYVCDTGIADAWEKSTGNDVTVAVIDSGVDASHEDLKESIWTNSEEIPNNGLDDDNNGYIDDVNGWNFAEHTNAVYDSADAVGDSHGTHVAGIIAAVKDNEKGITGAAPSSKIMPLKVFENGQAYTSDIISAIEYAESKGVKIVNCSWGGTYENQALKEAMQDSDMLFACAVGNSAADIDSTPIYPAAYNLDNIISVASVNQYGSLSLFSNYGENNTDVAAPGEEILSTLPGNEYGLKSGTSMATAFVSAEAALLLALSSNLSYTDLKSTIIDNAQKLESLTGKVENGNLLDVASAVNNIILTNRTKELNITGLNKLNADQKEYLRIINSIKHFADATKKQMKFISDFLGIDAQLLLETEKQRYSISECILVAKIIKNTKMSYQEIKEAFKNYTDLSLLYSASNQYAELTKGWKYPRKTEEELKQYFIKGRDILDIVKASVISVVFDVSLKDIIAQDNEDNTLLDESSSSKETKQLYTFVNANSISYRWLVQYLKGKNMTFEEFSKKIYEFYSSSSKASNVQQNVETTQEKPGNSRCALFAQQNTDYKAPYSYEEYEQDKIERNTGSLIIENVDLNLPGKNGLDFKLISRYDSDENRYYENEVEFIPDHSNYSYFYDISIREKLYNGNGILLADIINCAYNGIPFGEYKRILDLYNKFDNSISFLDNTQNIKHVFSAEVTRYYYANRSTFDTTMPSTLTYSYLDSPLGVGWSFTFDSIEIIKDSDCQFYNNYLQQQVYSARKVAGKYLHLSDGQKYKINDNMTLEGYKLKDMRISIDRSYINGDATSYYALIYKDGITKYFAEDGRLLATKDRYGNSITYWHEKINDHYVITKIIDTLGREVHINYDFNNMRVVITAPDSYQVIYHLSRASAAIDKDNGAYKYVYSVTDRVDAGNRTTTYEYGQFVRNDVHFTGVYGGESNEGSYVLNKVIYPTGMSIKYDFSNALRYGAAGTEYYPIVLKRTVYNKNGYEQNVKDYIYSNSNYTGYPFKEDESNQYYWLANVRPQTYKFNIVENLVFRTPAEEYEFDKENLLIGYRKYRNSTILYNSTEYKYNKDTDRQLRQQIVKTYTVPSFTNTEYMSDDNQNTNKYLQKVEDFNYDAYGNLVKYWGSEASRDSYNTLFNAEGDLHKVTYSYDTEYYNLLLNQEYKKDAATIITKANTLTSDRKGISESIIRQNGIPMSKLQYIYDAWGNIISEKAFTDVNSSNSYIEKQYSYLDNSGRSNYNGAYLTSHSVIEIKDNTATEEATVESNKYNSYGYVVEYTDPKGYKTDYQYDLLGREILKANRVDSTSATYNYNDADNIMTVKNENGTEIAYYFDEFGYLSAERDVLSGAYLKEYHYNGIFQLDFERNNTNYSNNYYKISYEYFSDGRIRTKTIRDKNDTLLAQEKYLYDDAFDIDNNGSVDYSKVTKIIIGDSNAPSMVTTQYTDRNGLLKREGKILNGEELYNTYNYDFAGNKIDGKSARANKESWTESTKYEYDYAGRLTKTQDVNNNISIITYDAAGRVKAKTDNLGNQASPTYSTLYEYDAMGRVVKESTPFEKVGSTIYYSIKKYTYDKNGNVLFEKISCNKPGETAAFRLTGYEYDNRNRLIKVITYKNTVTENDISSAIPENYTQYYYDSMGNKLRMYTGLCSPLTIEGLDNVTGLDTVYSTTKYSYDRFNQLVSMTDPFGKIESYAYDLNGNMISKTDRNGNMVTMAYDGLNRILSNSVVT
jgi:YD repeat-containing protein